MTEDSQIWSKTSNEMELDELTFSFHSQSSKQFYEPPGSVPLEPQSLQLTMDLTVKFFKSIFFLLSHLKKPSQGKTSADRPQDGHGEICADSSMIPPR